MKRMFLFYLKKLIRCPATYLAALALFLSMVLSIAPFPFPVCWPLYVFQYATYIGVAGYFVPVAAALPICYVRHALQSGGAWQFPLMHSSPRRYALGGLAAAFLSGALVMLLGLLLFFLFVVLTTQGPISFYTSLGNGVTPFELELSGEGQFLFRTAVFLTNGAMWAAVAYAASAFVSNQYLCAAVPFVLMISVSLPMQVLHWYYLDPMQLQLESDVVYGKDGGVSFLTIYTLTVVVLCGAGFFFRLKRRLHNG